MVQENVQPDAQSPAVTWTATEKAELLARMGTTERNLNALRLLLGPASDYSSATHNHRTTAGGGIVRGAAGVATSTTQNADTRSAWTDITGVTVTLNPGVDLATIFGIATFNSRTGDDLWQIRVVIGSNNGTACAAAVTGIAVHQLASQSGSVTVKAQYYVGGSGTDSIEGIQLLAVAIPGL